MSLLTTTFSEIPVCCADRMNRAAFGKCTLGELPPTDDGRLLLLVLPAVDAGRDGCPLPPPPPPLPPLDLAPLNPIDVEGREDDDPPKEEYMN